MAKLLFLAMTNAKAGRDDEFNDWYERHLRELLAAPGCVAVQRYALDEVQMLPAQPYRYLAIYEIETEDAAATMAALGNRVGSVGPSDAMDGSPLVTLFRPLGPRVVETADQVQP